MVEENKRTDGTNDEEKWEKDTWVRRRGGLLDLQGELLSHMTRAVRLRSPLRSALRQQVWESNCSFVSGSFFISTE